MDPKTFKLDTQWRTGRDNWRFDGFINRNHEWPSVRKRFGPSKSRSESQFRNVFITAPKAVRVRHISYYMETKERSIWESNWNSN